MSCNFVPVCLHTAESFAAEADVALAVCGLVAFSLLYLLAGFIRDAVMKYLDIHLFFSGDQICYGGNSLVSVAHLKASIDVSFRFLKSGLPVYQ